MTTTCRCSIDWAKVLRDLEPERERIRRAFEADVIKALVDRPHMTAAELLRELSEQSLPTAEAS